MDTNQNGVEDEEFEKQFSTQNFNRVEMRSDTFTLPTGTPSTLIYTLNYFR